MKRKLLKKWLPVKGLEGLYEVSNFGEIRSLRTSGNRFGKILKTSGPYCNVCMSGNNRNNVCVSTHRVVAEHFIPNPFNLPMVLHKDGNTKNNATTNLYWGTQLDNMRDRSAHIKMGLKPRWNGKHRKIKH